MADKEIVTVKWAGGEHPMTLRQKWVACYLEIRGLPGDYGSTPAACYKRFEQGVFAASDVEQVIRLGLIGGGATMRQADDLVDRFVRSRPVMENHETAITVLATLFAEREAA